MLKITTKLNLPIGADPKKLKDNGLCQLHGVILPLSEGGDAENEALIALYVKAQKHEKKLRKACKLAFTKGKQAFKKSVKTYLSSKRCLLVALFEDNACQKLQHRKSLEQLFALANQYDILKCLNEPAKISIRPKSSGFGTRQITSFGPVARAAQRMLVTMLRMTYQPQEFQFTKLGSAQKIQMAMSLINKKGYDYVLEYDITKFFPSFLEEELLTALPLPNEAIRQIALAKAAQWSCCSYKGPSAPYISKPPGMPQGSAFSSEIALWCVAHILMKNIEGVTIINHADNFFIFAISQTKLEEASKALNSAIAELPGGNFTAKIEQKTTIFQGFRMLGCDVYLDNLGELVADPSDPNIQKIRGKFSLAAQAVRAKLIEASAEGSEVLRLQALQDFLRLESLAGGWVNAFEFCGPEFDCVEDELNLELGLIRWTYVISDEELGPLKDASTVVNINWYSGQ